jgi:hypothetical protein
MKIDDLKNHVRTIGKKYTDREQRARRLFIEERAASLHNERDREFAIKTEISNYFRIAYSAVSFSGSGQIGFSIHKDKFFEPSVSDLDVACIDVELFQRAWIDVVSTTRAFTDLTPFGKAIRLGQHYRAGVDHNPKPHQLNVQLVASECLGRNSEA